MFNIYPPDSGIRSDLALYRLMDARRRNRAASFERAYAELLEHHNALVRQYNDLLAQAQQNEQAVRNRDAALRQKDEELRQKNERIVELEDFLAGARKRLQTLMYE
jgi:hypothetical protein